MRVQASGLRLPQPELEPVPVLGLYFGRLQAQVHTRLQTHYYWPVPNAPNGPEGSRQREL